jgi:hypothetical protein
MARKKNGWFKPYVLNPSNIEKVVGSEGPGVYVLANLGQDRKLLVEHIKSSGNVKTQLKQALGKYPIFMYKPFKHQLEKYRQQQAMLQLV